MKIRENFKFIERVEFRKHNYSCEILHIHVSHSIGMFDNNNTFVYTISFSNYIFALSYIWNDVMRFPHPECSEYLTYMDHMISCNRKLFPNLRGQIKRNIYS